MYVRPLVLLYADDIVILAESHVDLQDALNVTLHYCNMWGLLVNTAKTKVTVFCKSKRKSIFEFEYYLDSLPTNLTLSLYLNLE